MYFLGAEHLALAFIPMWTRIGAQYGNNHKVAAAFPNDSDGNAFRAVFPPILKGAGHDIDMSAAYADGLTNYTSMISRFRSAGADFFTNAEACHRGQGAAVPDRRLCDGKQGLQHRHRRLVGAVPAVALLPDPSTRSTSPRRSPDLSTTPPPARRPIPRPAWRSPRRSAFSGRRARPTRSRPRSSTTPCSRWPRSPATCCRRSSEPRPGHAGAFLVLHPRRVIPPSASSVWLI
jgi:hypothetical protein